MILHALFQGWEHDRPGLPDELVDRADARRVERRGARLLVERDGGPAAIAVGELHFDLGPSIMPADDGGTTDDRGHRAGGGSMNTMSLGSSSTAGGRARRMARCRFHESSGCSADSTSGASRTAMAARSSPDSREHVSSITHRSQRRRRHLPRPLSEHCVRPEWRSVPSRRRPKSPTLESQDPIERFAANLRESAERERAQRDRARLEQQRARDAADAAAERAAALDSARRELEQAIGDARAAGGQAQVSPPPTQRGARAKSRLIELETGEPPDWAPRV